MRPQITSLQTFCQSQSTCALHQMSGCLHKDWKIDCCRVGLRSHPRIIGSFFRMIRSTGRLCLREPDSENWVQTWWRGHENSVGTSEEEGNATLSLYIFVDPLMRSRLDINLDNPQTATRSASSVSSSVSRIHPRLHVFPFQPRSWLISTSHSKYRRNSIKALSHLNR